MRRLPMVSANRQPAALGHKRVMNSEELDGGNQAQE
jgi:hypothetical protein